MSVVGVDKRLNNVYTVLKGGEGMKAVIRKWGNGQGILISKHLMNEVGLAIGEPVELEVKNGQMVITKANKKGCSFEQIMEAFYGKPYASLADIRLDEPEVDTGLPVGSEVL